MKAATVSLTLALCCAVAPVRAAESVESGAATTMVAPEEELSEVVIQAREPRYVAPTQLDRIGRVWVPVFLNGRGPFRLVLDSGATHSAITPFVVQQLGLSTSERPPVLMRGVTGSAITPVVRVESLSVGDLEVGSSTVPVVADAFGGADGLLGSDGMSDKRIYIDFRHDFVNIGRSRNRRADAGFTAIPLLSGQGRLLVVDATVAGIRTRAILDTGAQASIGNDALRAALDRRRRRDGTMDIITGATGDMQRGEGLIVSPVVIGGLQVRNAHVTFGNVHLFNTWAKADEPTLLVGMDVLGLVDTLVIDYRRREVHIKPRSEGRRAPNS